MVSGVLSIPISGRGLDSRTSDKDRYRLPLRRFVAGKENRLAVVAITSLLGDRLESDTLDNNGPLIFHGSSGTGKSHLAIGIARHFKQRQTSARVVYTTAVDLSRQPEDESSEQPYRSSNWFTGVSLLVVDDVDQLADKVDVQHQLVRILDAVSQSGGHIVVTSHSNPTQRTDLIAPLRSRLSSGLVVQLVKPEVASRRVIVEEIATSRGFLLPPETIDRLAKQLDGTVPELIGAIVQLQVTSQANQSSFDSYHNHSNDTDKSLANEVDHLLDRYAETNEITIHRIALNSAKYFDVKLSEMRSASRKKSLVTARGIAIYLARQLTDNSLQHLGNYFGKRDHTTILHNVQKIEQLAGKDPHISRAIESIKQRLHA